MVGYVGCVIFCERLKQAQAEYVVWGARGRGVVNKHFLRASALGVQSWATPDRCDRPPRLAAVGPIRGRQILGSPRPHPGTGPPRLQDLPTPSRCGGRKAGRWDGRPAAPAREGAGASLGPRRLAAASRAASPGCWGPCPGEGGAQGVAHSAEASPTKEPTQRLLFWGGFPAGCGLQSASCGPPTHAVV